MGDSSKNRGLRAKVGFTLIEAMVATMLIAVAMVALVLSSQAFTQVNNVGIELSTAEFLIEEIRELTAPLEFDELATFAAGSPFSPPIDVSGVTLGEFPDFEQQVTVENVSASDFTVSDPGSDFARVTVTILRNNSRVSSANWIRAR
jgi:type II secretory pathway pseudopilin PulG